MNTAKNRIKNNDFVTEQTSSEIGNLANTKDIFSEEDNIMKRVFALIACLVATMMFFSVASSEQQLSVTDLDLSLYSHDDLVLLRDRINQILAEEQKDYNNNVIYEDDNISVVFSDLYVKERTTSPWVYLELIVENKTDSIISLYAKSYIVNGFSFDLNAYAEIPAKTKQFAELSSIHGDLYKKAKIQTIESVGLVMNYKDASGSIESGTIQSTTLDSHKEKGSTADILEKKTDEESTADVTEKKSDIDINAIVEEILACKNDETEKAHNLIQEYHSLMSDDQLERCLLSYGRWEGFNFMEQRLIGYLKNPKSYEMYSGTVTSPKLQDDGSYKIDIEIKYYASNSYGGVELDTKEMYAYFVIDKSKLDISFTKSFIRRVETLEKKH